MDKLRLLGGFGVCLLALATTTHAAVFDAIDRGWYNETGQHVASIQNTLTGDLACCNLGIHRSYFTFDLSTLSETANAATLRLELDAYLSPDAFESATIWNVSPSNLPLLDTDNSIGSATGQSIFADLGSGAAYGSFTVATPGTSITILPAGSSILEISLNGSAIADIVASTGGLFAVGISLDTIAGGTAGEYVRFSFENEIRTHQLITSPVPIPAAVWLFSSGLLWLIGIARRKKAA